MEGKSGDAVIASVRAHMRDWLGLEKEPTDEEVSVQVRPDEKTQGNLMLAVTVTPPAKILPAGIPVVMGYTLRG